MESSALNVRRTWSAPSTGCVNKSTFGNASPSKDVSSDSTEASFWGHFKLCIHHFTLQHVCLPVLGHHNESLEWSITRCLKAWALTPTRPRFEFQSGHFLTVTTSKLPVSLCFSFPCKMTSLLQCSCQEDRQTDRYPVCMFVHYIYILLHRQEERVATLGTGVTRDC